MLNPALIIDNTERKNMKMNDLIADFADEICGARQHAFPYLGAVAFMEPLDDMASDAGVSPLSQFSPIYASESYRREMIESTLDTGRKKPIYTKSIDEEWFLCVDGLHAVTSLITQFDRCKNKGHEIFKLEPHIMDELKQLAGLLETATRRHSLFRVFLRESDSTPKELMRWQYNIFRDTAECVMGIIEKLQRNEAEQAIGANI